MSNKYPDLSNVITFKNSLVVNNDLQVKMGAKFDNIVVCNGLLILNTTTISSNTTIAKDDNYSIIFVDTSLADGDVTITLPDPTSTLDKPQGGTNVSDGRMLRIIDSGGSASTKNIIIDAASGNISGRSVITLDQNYSSTCLVSSATEWFLC